MELFFYHFHFHFRQQVEKKCFKWKKNRKNLKVEEIHRTGHHLKVIPLMVENLKRFLFIRKWKKNVSVFFSFHH